MSISVASMRPLPLARPEGKPFGLKYCHANKPAPRMTAAITTRSSHFHRALAGLGDGGTRGLADALASAGGSEGVGTDGGARDVLSMLEHPLTPRLQGAPGLDL